MTNELPAAPTTIKARVLELLSDGVPRTARAIADALGARDCAVSNVLVKLRKANEVHIVGWPENETGKPSETHAFGPGENAPRPPAKPRDSGSRRPDDAVQPKGVPAPSRDPLVAALFGERGSGGRV